MTALAGPSFPGLVQDFFTQRLVAERRASPQTVASYRATFRLLLAFTAERQHRSPAGLGLADLEAPTILAFLDHLEAQRGNGARTRNLRLTAVRSFMRYVARRDPTAVGVVQRILAIPTKRFDRPIVGSLTREEMDAIIAAPVATTWSGRRDRVLWATLYNTGARVSEVIGLRRQDVMLEGAPCVQLHGKGRKDRSVPLWKTTRAALHRWLADLPPTPTQPVFPNRGGHPLTRSGIEHRLRLAVRAATSTCPSLRDRRVSPHVLRHTTAMHLLQAGVDLTVIALWLGHEQPGTTHQYLEADLKMKERALEAIRPADVPAGRYRPKDRLLAFLERL